jgi:hypothetical protein
MILHNGVQDAVIVFQRPEEDGDNLAMSEVLDGPLLEKYIELIKQQYGVRFFRKALVRLSGFAPAVLGSARTLLH